MRIGIDWGGTKLEVIALDKNGRSQLRRRVTTPSTYDAAVEAVVGLVAHAENELGVSASVGLGIPGTISPATGLVKNANSTWMNGRPLKEDLERQLNREVRIENDANCFAVSEAVDGAGAGVKLVAGVILGTGCGCGLSFDGRVHSGRNRIAGEFGHVPLGWLGHDEFPGPSCWCGKNGCHEVWISGTGFQRAYRELSGEKTIRPVEEILRSGTGNARKTYEDYCSRLGRALALLINVMDPDVVVLGGGMSKVDQLYNDLPPIISQYVFSDVFDTPVLPPVHGDSSGVRGAAWLW